MQQLRRMVTLMFNLKRVFCALLVVIVALFAIPKKSAADYICGADLNLDGDTDDKGELQGCWQAADGVNYLCPIKTGGCMAAYSSPVCSDGGVLNTLTDQCELAGGVTCPTGYTYDPASNLCSTASICQGGGTLDAANDVCKYNIICPNGYFFSSLYQGCVKAPTCPAGGYYSSAVGTISGWITVDRCIATPVISCLQGYTWGTYWNGTATVYGCLKDACPSGYQGIQYTDPNYPYSLACFNWPTLSCPTGYTLDYDNYWYEDFICKAPKTYCTSGGYNTATQKCELNVTSNIPSGYVLDTQTGAYLGDPSCPSGTTYNAAINLCESTLGSLQCPEGYAINSSSTGCEALKCPDGVWICSYDDVEKCTSSANVNCAPELVFQGGYCSTSPTCDTDATYSQSLNACMHNATYGCPAGYTYNTTVGRCQQEPVCPVDTVYDPAQDRCVTLSQAPGICPLGAYACDTTAGTCTKAYPCNTGFQTMDICAQNCDVACTSSCNTDAIAALGDVFWTETAASWFGITGVTGSNDQLIFYGKDGSYQDIEVGRITMNGCNFSGSASYFTPSGDSCSSTSWGLSGISATGNQLSFLGGECGTNAGSITVTSCYINIPVSSTSFDITHVVGSGATLAFYGGLSGNQPLISMDLCQYSFKCPSCQVTKSCVYTCPDPSYTLLSDFRCGVYATCPFSGALSAQLDKCETVAIEECPLGYSLSNGECLKAPACPAGTALDPVTDRCVTLSGITCHQRPSGYSQNYAYDPATSKCVLTVYTDPKNLICPGNTATVTIAPATYCASDKCSAAFSSATCPANTALNTASGKCEAPPSGFGILDTALDKFVYYAVTTCPSGWVLSGDKCILDPICPGTGIWSSWVGACKVNIIYSCPSGYTYSATYGTCQTNVLCAEGSDQVISGRCLSPTYQVTCPVNYSYDSTLQKCATQAVCEIGTLDTAIDYCKVSDPAVLCPVNYTINFAKSRCEAAPSCLTPGTYSTSLDKCTAQPNYNCPAGYAYVNGICYKLPDCPNGTYQAATDDCYDGLTQCSLGNYPCYSYSGQVLCSPYPCVDQTNPTITDTAQSTLASPQNDGTVDNNGKCSGQFYILSGTAGECRTSGTQTLFKNCCNTANAMNPMFCDVSNEGAVAQKAAQGMCHYVGTYCTEKWALIGCVQSKKVYCCFNSKLARIINEQGRNQLQSFQPDMWGVPENPVCRGFTPEEFQMLDFSKIDLTEFFNDIKSNLPLPADVKQGAEQKIYDYYQNVQ